MENLCSYLTPKGWLVIIFTLLSILDMFRKFQSKHFKRNFKLFNSTAKFGKKICQLEANLRTTVPNCSKFKRSNKDFKKSLQLWRSLSV